MPIGTFGTVIFEVSTEKSRTFDEFNRKTAAKFEEHAIIGQKAKLEFISPGLDEISFQVIFSAFHGLNPLKEADQLREIVRKGEYHPLVIGGKVIGNFVLESLSESWKYVDNRGNVLHIALDVSLKEYVLEPAPVKAATTGTAAAEEKKVDKVTKGIKEEAKKSGLDKAKDVAALAKKVSAAVKDPMSAITGANGLLKNVQGLQDVAKVASLAQNKNLAGALNTLSGGQLEAYKLAGMNVMDLAWKAQTSPQGAIVDLLGGIAKVDPKNKLEVAKKLVGEKAAGPVVQLSKKSNELKQEFDKGVVNV